MSTIDEKIRQLNDVETVRFISSALFEISARQMTRLREALAENNEFYNEISELYDIVKRSASIQKHLKSNSDKARGLKQHSVAVVFTSNKRFYGSLNRDLVETFMKDVSDDGIDRIVVGDTGREIIEITRGAPTCQFLSFEQDEPTPKEAQQFLERVRGYNQIFVYYPTFVSVFMQKISKIDITHTPTTLDGDKDMVEYIFEPELPQILTFFEQRVRQLLFGRVLLETDLARVAARFVAMSMAERQANELEKKLTLSIRNQKEATSNRELLEALTGITKWRHKQENL